MRAVRLAGDLGERFGAEWHLDVRTPGEALRAIEANRPGFLAHLVASAQDGVAYRVMLDNEDVQVENLQSPFGRETLHVVPVIGGAKSAGAGILIGAALIASAFIPGAGQPLFTLGTTAFSAASIAANVGIGLVLGGVAQMLVGTPKAPDLQNANPADTLPSYFFNGAVNVAGQGNPVPVGYGELIVGGVPISGGVASNNLVVV